MPVLAMLLPKPPPYKTQRAEMIVLKGWKFTFFVVFVLFVEYLLQAFFFAGGDGRNKRDRRILLFSGESYKFMVAPGEI